MPGTVLSLPSSWSLAWRLVVSDLVLVNRGVHGVDAVSNQAACHYVCHKRGPRESYNSALHDLQSGQQKHDLGSHNLWETSLLACRSRNSGPGTSRSCLLSSIENSGQHMSEIVG